MSTAINKSIFQVAEGAEAGHQLLLDMLELMGWPPEDMHVLLSMSPFRGTGGLMCRWRVSRGGSGPLVQPLVMLPTRADELPESGVARLLDVQAMLVSELGWHLVVSREGLMQLSPLDWFDGAVLAVQALDLGNVLAMQALRALVDGSEDAPHQTGSGSFDPMGLLSTNLTRH